MWSTLMRRLRNVQVELHGGTAGVATHVTLEGVLETMITHVQIVHNAVLEHDVAMWASELLIAWWLQPVSIYFLLSVVHVLRMWLFFLVMWIFFFLTGYSWLSRRKAVAVHGAVELFRAFKSVI